MKSSVELVKIWLKGLPNSRICQIMGAGHAIHVEEPEKFGTMSKSEFLSNR